MPRHDGHRAGTQSAATGGHRASREHLHTAGRSGTQTCTGGARATHAHTADHPTTTSTPQQTHAGPTHHTHSNTTPTQTHHANAATAAAAAGSRHQQATRQTATEQATRQPNQLGLYQPPLTYQLVDTANRSNQPASTPPTAPHHTPHTLNASHTHLPGSRHEHARKTAGHSAVPDNYGYPYRLAGKRLTGACAEAVGTEYVLSATCCSGHSGVVMVGSRLVQFAGLGGLLGGGV
jgi:hypothetical protein